MNPPGTTSSQVVNCRKGHGLEMEDSRASASPSLSLSPSLSPSPSPSDPAKTSSLNPPAASLPIRPVRIYHSSSETRIDEILETARKRRVAAMETGQPLPVPPMSPTQAARPSEPSGEGAESSADEHTAIMRQQSGRVTNYQSTGTSATAGNTAATVRRRQTQERRPQPAAAEDSDAESHQPWWKKQVEKLGSIELENKGSVARDHLALERTFLAWLRTSLAFASIGIAVTQLFRLNTTSTSNSGSSGDPYYHLRQLGKPLGATFLGISILVLFVGFHRYFESQHWIIKGKFPASRGSIVLITVVALALMVTSLIVVIVVEPSASEKK